MANLGNAQLVEARFQPQRISAHIAVKGIFKSCLTVSLLTGGKSGENVATLI